MYNYLRFHKNTKDSDGWYLWFHCFFGSDFADLGWAATMTAFSPGATTSRAKSRPRIDWKIASSSGSIGPKTANWFGDCYLFESNWYQSMAVFTIFYSTNVMIGIEWSSIYGCFWSTNDHWYRMIIKCTVDLFFSIYGIFFYSTNVMIHKKNKETVSDVRRNSGWSCSSCSTWDEDDVIMCHGTNCNQLQPTGDRNLQSVWPGPTMPHLIRAFRHFSKALHPGTTGPRTVLHCDLRSISQLDPGCWRSWRIKSV